MRQPLDSRADANEMGFGPLLPNLINPIGMPSRRYEKRMLQLAYQLEHSLFNLSCEAL